MADKVLMPSLSETGWLTSSEITGDLLFAHFFASDYSQTEIYSGHVSSFAKVMQENTDNVDNLVIDLRNTLLRYYSRYFQNVVVEVQIKDNSENISKLSLLLYVVYTDNDGKQHNLSKIVRDITSKSAKIIDFNNTGKL